jgi:ribulose-5-phosphate 4-epimerase/fuculose-1-phosphate aldolase
VFRLQMPDAGFDRRASLHPSPKRPRCPTSLPPVHAHSYRAFIIVAAITHARAG